MSYFVKRGEVEGIPASGHVSYPMLKEENGCVKGFCSGITIYSAADYPTTGVHDDQEGFVVLEGTGWARVGEQEMRIEPEMCFVAPAGVPHSIKKDVNSVDLKVCWFHGAVEKGSTE